MKALIRFSIALTVTLGFLGNGRADDWLGFRGTKGTGVSPDKNTPLKWSGTENIAWKTKLPGPGDSSPVVVGDKIFLTCYTGLPSEKLVRHLLCLDRAKGDLLWQKDLPAKLPEFAYTGFMKEHGYASSTPVSDGKNVYVFFGRSGVYAFDLKGNPLWHKDVGSGLHEWGSAASPVLFNNVVIVNAGIESGSVVGLDKNSGNEVWRKKTGTSWATPILVDVPGGKTELVVNQPGTKTTEGVIQGLDPETGNELWTCTGMKSPYVCPSPVARNGVVYVTAGGVPYPAFGLAVRAGGRGDVTKTHVVWKKGIGSGISSPVVKGKYLFALDRGKLGCFRAENGEPVLSRPVAFKGREYTSPTVADGKLYFVNRAGTTYVFSADDKMRPLGENSIEEEEPRFDGSPVVSGGQLLLRSTHYLYCVGKK